MADTDRGTEAEAHFGRRFTTPLSGPSHRWSAKLVAIVMTALTLAVLAFAIYHVGGSDWVAIVFIIAVGAMMVSNCWYIVKGRTWIDAVGLHQDWFTTKTYPWAAIHAASVLRMPFSTRLVISAGRGPYRAITAGDPTLVKAFEEIAAFYRPVGRR
ncbi:MAG: hypothetical protein R3E48_22740 [Burkholderiaceae bacterium]